MMHLYDRLVGLIGRYYHSGANTLVLPPREAREAAGILIGLGYVIAKNADLDPDAMLDEIKARYAVVMNERKLSVVVQGGLQ